MRRIVIQVVFVAAIAAVLFYLLSNVRENLDRQGIGTSFDYLSQPAGFAIPNSDFRSSQTLQEALYVGIANTAKVSFLGIIIATILGVAIGVARLSSNWLVRKAAALYVELFRNIPVLVIILFWYLAVLLQLPEIGVAIEWGNYLVLSNRGLVLPWAEQTAGVALFWGIVAVGALIALIAVVLRTRHFNATGKPHHRVLWGGGILLGALVIAFFASGQPFSSSLPEKQELTVEGGLRLTPEYAALLIGLAIYTASHIAEIVRGAILAIPRGQNEAADAMGLSGFQRYRFVILPQAMRIIIPPLTNQYLNLVKNSSLGVAIAFPEVTRITRITISQGGPAPQAILVLMIAYLVFSLSISLITNLVNRRLAMKGR